MEVNVGFTVKLHEKNQIFLSSWKPYYVIREKLVLLESVDLKDNRDPVERLELQDLLVLLEHRFVYHMSLSTQYY